MITLPIDSHIDDILACPVPSRLVVATPGSGKTTRIPPAICRAGTKKVLCAEPRRIACIAAASRIAHEQNWQMGREIGYHVRFEKKYSSETQLVFVTHGMLLQYLCADPFLEDFGEIIFDEFHERSIESDIAMAMVRYIQTQARSDLGITVMSATLDADRMSQWLAPCKTYHVQTPLYPLDIRYSSHPFGMRSDDDMTEMIRQCRIAMDETEGDCLVFLPGLADIHTAIDRARSEFGDLYEYVPCHASLPLDQQKKVLNPDNLKRRLIFSTNVAESSLTIPGVRSVIDSGFAKRKFYDSISGLSRLETLRISKSSADQRAGRAARLGPGLCIRLWNDQIQNQLAAQASPEIDHLDLSQALLQISAWGIETAENLDYVTRPTQGRMRDAQRLLYMLDAIDSDNIVTPVGKTMSRLPVEPRLARWLMAAVEYHCLDDAALMAAYLSESPYRRSQQPDWPGPDLYNDFIKLKKEIRRPEYSQIRKSANDIAETAHHNIQSLKHASGCIYKDPREALARSMLCAYPDRIAQARPNKDRDKLSESDPRRDVTPVLGLMSGNRGVILKEPHSLKDAKFFICADLNLVKGVERASNTVVKALEVKSEWLPWKEEITARYESDKDRVVIANSVHFDSFTLRETFLHDDKYIPLARKTLLNAALESPEKVLNFNSDAVQQLIARLKFIQSLDSGYIIPEFDINWGKTLLPELVKNASNFEELRQIDLSHYIYSSLDYSIQAALNKLAPRQVTLENGYTTDVDYTQSPPVIRVKIQKAFGVFNLPKIGGNRICVMIHLCAPNGRPAQVTQDLNSFWHHTYSDVRKLLRGRYPKHDWPEIPPGV